MERKREKRKEDSFLTIKNVYNEALKELEASKIEEAGIQVKLLMEFVFGISSMDFVLNPNKELDTRQYDFFIECVEKRIKRIPLQHITGKADFMGLEFLVNENVLIPRFDTENLVEKLLPLCGGKKVLDMCTGSGCIILSLAKLCDMKEGFGVDISSKALEVARENKNELGISNVEFIESDLFSQITQRDFDIMVSNPPYIATEVIDTLMDEVKLHDPYIALDGKEDGLHFYRKISKQAREHLKKDGILALEIGYDQGISVSDILQKDGYTDIKCYKDLSGLDRVIIARKDN